MKRMILILSIGLFCLPLFAQVGLRYNPPADLLPINVQLLPSSQRTKVNIRPNSITKPIPSLMTSWSNLKYWELGIFCRLDAGLDKKLPYKLRFRLGEYHYSRQLEGYD